MSVCGATPSSAHARRHADKTHRSGTLRFLLVLLILIATAVVVTIVMFNTLYIVMRLAGYGCC